MHCPKCGQQQISEATRFCSRCGFLLTGIAEIIGNGGLIPKQPTALTGDSGSPRRRGVMQGIFAFLLSFLIVPILIIISIALDIDPYAAGISLFLLTVGGLLRVIYAMMFESSFPAEKKREQQFVNQQPTPKELPPEHSIPASDYAIPAAGSWGRTNDLHQPSGSVTEGTTRLLKEDQ